MSSTFVDVELRLNVILNKWPTNATQQLADNSDLSTVRVKTTLTKQKLAFSEIASHDDLITKVKLHGLLLLPCHNAPICDETSTKTARF